MMEDYVALGRQFSQLSKDQNNIEQENFLLLLGENPYKTWEKLFDEYRTVILAEAGSGKTVEFRQQAQKLYDEGKPSFFIRIEDIESDFYNSFEVGDNATYQDWLASTEEAWFFLDSVDEAKLEHPRLFEKALDRFKKSIKDAELRAHIYISSRPYSWRPDEDRDLIEKLFFLTEERPDTDKNSKEAKKESALKVYKMLPLDYNQIQKFCTKRSVTDLEDFILEIKRNNLESLTERPFDLDGLISKWNDDKELGSRLGLFRYNIDKKLSDEHNSDRALRQPLNLEKAKRGARRLAAAVILSGKSGINIRDATSEKPGINADNVLWDWDLPEVESLLSRGIFNGIIYGAVRFRLRDTRELLAAQWFSEILESGNSRVIVESLFFRKHYGEDIISKRLRSILSWLILYDDNIQQRVIDNDPEIAIEGGDPSMLSKIQRKKILNDIVFRIKLRVEKGPVWQYQELARFAKKDLSDDVIELFNNNSDNDDIIFFLARLVLQSDMKDCIEPLMDIAVDLNREMFVRIVSIRAIMTCGSKQQKLRVWEEINDDSLEISRNLLAEFFDWIEYDDQFIELIFDSFNKLEPYNENKFNRLEPAIHRYIEKFQFDNNQEIKQFLTGLHTFLKQGPHITRRNCEVSKEYAWLLNPAIHFIERLIKIRNPLVFEDYAISILLMAPAIRLRNGAGVDDYKNSLVTLIPDWADLNDSLYWANIKQARSFRPSDRIIHIGHVSFNKHY